MKYLSLATLLLSLLPATMGKGLSVIRLADEKQVKNNGTEKKSGFVEDQQAQAVDEARRFFQRNLQLSLPSDFPSSAPSPLICPVEQIDFEQFDLGDTPGYLGYGTTVSGLSLEGFPAMIFNSRRPTGRDYDLRTNDLGMILILSEDGDSSDPDDSRSGGTMTFTFGPEVQKVERFLFIDNEEISAVSGIFKDGSVWEGKQISVTPNRGRVIVDIQLELSSMTVTFGASGAIGFVEVAYCPEDETDLGPDRRMLAEAEAETETDSSVHVTEQEAASFDFVLAGFPKCGTTSLLKVFEQHSQTSVPSDERCEIADVRKPDGFVQRSLDKMIGELCTSTNVKRGFKCPSAIYNYKSISRMEKHSPRAKFVVGVRHPVLMLQSFYNYRVTEIHDLKSDEIIPSFDEVIASGLPWKGVSASSSQYELFLMQFGKTAVSSTEMRDFFQHEGFSLAIRPNNFTIFLYNVDQMEDEDESRSAAFRDGLRKYLDLTEPIAPFTKENVNHNVGNDKYPETIDICQDSYKNLRSDLVRQGARTAAWLREKFLASSDVVVANKEHFIESLSTWSVDPCMEESGDYYYYNSALSKLRSSLTRAGATMLGIPHEKAQVVSG